MAGKPQDASASYFHGRFSQRQSKHTQAQVQPAKLTVPTGLPKSVHKLWKTVAGEMLALGTFDEFTRPMLEDFLWLWAGLLDIRSMIAACKTDDVKTKAKLYQLENARSQKLNPKAEKLGLYIGARQKLHLRPRVNEADELENFVAGKVKAGG